MQEKIKFDKKQKVSGINKYGHYQFGANCCIGCKIDRPINAKGEWCDICLNYNK